MCDSLSTLPTSSSIEGALSSLQEVGAKLVAIEKEEFVGLLISNGFALTNQWTSQHDESESSENVVIRLHTASKIKEPEASGLRRVLVTLNPVSTLNRLQNWVIKVRVTSKIWWPYQAKKGNCFSMVLTDESGEIFATVFEDLFDKYRETMKLDQIYYISKGDMELSPYEKPRLNNVLAILFTQQTVVQPCHPDDTFPKIHYDFQPLSQVASFEVQTMIDVIGVCIEAGESVEFVTNYGKSRVKRELILVDTSGTRIMLAIWGEDAEKFDGRDQPVVAVKRAQVYLYLGAISLIMGQGSSLRINPDLEETRNLRDWFQRSSEFDDDSSTLDDMSDITRDISSCS